VNGRAIGDEQGTMLPVTAGLVLVAFSIIAIVVELSLLGAAYRDVATVADLAAEAGASMLSAADAYGSQVELDTAAAEQEARRVSGTWGSGDEIVAVTIVEGRLCVTVSDLYRPQTLVFIGVTEVDVSVTGCAEPRAG